MKASLIIGFAILAAFILYGIISGGNSLMFINFPSIFIVGGILIGGTLISFGCSLPLNALKKALQKEGVKDRNELREYVSVYTMASRLSIAAGIIGTLIGAVQMLTLTDDPLTIGPSTACALLTVFYGVLLSELVFQPLKYSLITKSAELFENTADSDMKRDKFTVDCTRFGSICVFSSICFAHDFF